MDICLNKTNFRTQGLVFFNNKMFVMVAAPVKLPQGHQAEPEIDSSMN